MRLPSPLRGQRPIAAAALLAATVGLGTLGPTAPAAAATIPTITTPAWRTGFGPITISGTAAPSATVTLIEAAYVYRTDMKPAINYATGDVLRTVADSTGHYSLKRDLDSGFVFAVESGGVRSRTITASIRVMPSVTLSSNGAGTVNVGVVADPGQPGRPSVLGTHRLHLEQRR